MANMRRYPDEDSVRVRPQRMGSRPRTKRRPSHDDAQWAMVTAVDRGRYTTLPREGDQRVVTAMKARELGKRGIVVGDLVGLVGDTSAAPGSLARIVKVAPRTTALRRTADDDDPVERVVVANADQLVVVTALSNPTPRPRMIDRLLVAAFDAGMSAVLCLTKADLTDPEELASLYRPLDVPIVVVGMDSHGDLEGVEQVEKFLRGRISVLVGHSGVGKSTLVNHLVLDAARQVGDVNSTTGRGRHTSTSAVALSLPGGGWVIDTPGVRSFGLAHVEPNRVIAAFPDLAQVIEQCPRGCTHLAGAPDCEMDVYLDSLAALPGGDAQRAHARVDSLRRLLSSRTS